MTFSITATNRIYFAVTFSIAFVLGTVRTLGVIPLVGEVWAVAIVLPFMVAVSWWACGFALRRVSVETTLTPRLIMALTAFILLLTAEAGLSLTLGGLTVRQHVALYATTPVRLGLAGQALFAIFPVVRL